METAPFTDLITPDVRISLLGTPRIGWAGQSFVIPRRQTRALLFYLATRLQSTPRDRLHLLLWPDWPESLARRHLTRLLSHLRRALPAPEILIATEEEIRLDPHRVWSDTADFECLHATRNPSHRIEALRQAAGLYRGPFLDGFSLPTSEFEAWTLQERTCFERLYLDALETLIQDRADQKAYDEAIAYAQRYLEIDETRWPTCGYGKPAPIAGSAVTTRLWLQRRKAFG